MNKCLIYNFLGLFTLISLSATASADERTIQEMISSEILENQKSNFLTLTVENDSLGRGTDKDYTSGIRLTYFNVSKKSEAWIDGLDRILPIFAVNETSTTSYSIGQNLYTPLDIKEVEQLPNTRPYAAFLYGSANLSTVTNNYADDLELTLGMVGPVAQGEESQRFIHKALDFDKPEGWEHQLEDEPGIILSWRRRWLRLFNKEMGDLSLSLEPNIGGSVGNIYTLAETGFTARLAPSYDRWQDTPLIVKPSIPGSGFFQPTKGRLGWFLFGGAQGRVVANNIFLDGNTFKETYHVEKIPYVLDLNAGIALTIKNVRVSYALIYRTKEFETQDDSSLFGTISMGYRF